MTVPRPHDRLISTHATADEALESFTVRLPRWPIFGLFRRNPLIRASDRIEALAMAVAVMVSLLAVPVAAAVGTAVHDSHRDDHHLAIASATTRMSAIPQKIVSHNGLTE